jgi:uncharacterized protein YerC
MAIAVTPDELQAMTWEQRFWVCFQALLEMEMKFEDAKFLCSKDRWTTPQTLEVRELIGIGLSYREIAAKTGATYQRVWRIARSRAREERD